jgi:ribonuclease III
LGLKIFSRFFSGRKAIPALNHDFQKFITNKLKINPDNWSLYEQAFRHRTLSATPQESNERLEFVGDAILDAAIASWLYNNYADKDEGFLSKMKSRVVSRVSLNKLALEMGIDAHVRTKLKTDLAKHAVCGNALEAVIGAIYEDKGYNAAAQWIDKFIIGRTDFSLNMQELNDAKSELFERAHRDDALLKFQTENIHSLPEPLFETIVYWRDIEAGRATGASKKLAEQNAARKALEFLNET